MSALGGVHELDLGYTQVSNVSALSTVDILNLRACQRLVDVSRLGYVTHARTRTTSVHCADRVRCVCTR